MTRLTVVCGWNKKITFCLHSCRNAEIEPWKNPYLSGQEKLLQRPSYYAAADLLINLALSLLFIVICTTAATAAGQGCVLIFHTLASELHLEFRLSWGKVLVQTQLAILLYVNHAHLTELYQHSCTSGKCACRQEVGYRHKWPQLEGLPAFKTCFLFWLGHLQHVLPAHWTLILHQTALASFILTNVDICDYD